MTPPAIQCPKCQTELDPGFVNQLVSVPCPGCGWLVEVEIFPALRRPLNAGPAAENILVEGESSCFYHPQKKAVLPCHGCGRFLCALCDCELNGQHFCPACLETGQSKGRIQNLANRRTLYDNIALSLATLPLLLFYFTIITAPMSLYIAVRYWNAPRSIVYRSRIRYVIAIILSTLQIAGWALGILFLITASHG